jgi:DNA-binding CsgD family transcriptional regulator
MTKKMKTTTNKDALLIEKIRERAKELNCLYGLSRLTENRRLSLEEFLQEAVRIVPPAWQHSKRACARINYCGKYYATSRFRKTGFRLAAKIEVFGKNTGEIEVCYLGGENSWREGFLKEEKKLLTAIAGQISKTLERRKIEEEIVRSRTVLLSQKKALERKNIALNEIIEQVEYEKNIIKQNISANIEQVVWPVLNKLKLVKGAERYAKIISSHLDTITGSFGRKIIQRRINLTPREIEICKMIKGDLSNKDMANMLGLSLQTIEKHRKNIRKKLKLSNKKINLATFIQHF